MNGRRVLGRGLDSLIPQATTGQSDGIGMGSVHLVPVEMIVPNPRQPRSVFDSERLEELSRSIQEKGIIEPLIVRPRENGLFELVAGERRLRAAQLAGRREVPVLFRSMDERTSLEIALIENLQREDLNPVDEARAYQRLADEFGRTHADISKEVGKDRSTVSNLMRLLRLPESVLDLVSRGTLSAGHARVLLSLEEPQEQAALASRMAEEGWSVRQAEHHLSAKRPATGAETKRATASAPPAQKDREVLRVEEALQYHLGTQVTLTHGPNGGKIEIRYFSTEELERVLELLGVEIH